MTTDLFAIAVKNARIVGKQTADYMEFLNLQNTHCIGHSLGVAVCAFAAKHKKWTRLTSTDGAGPYMKDAPKENRLDAWDVISKFSNFMKK